MVKKYDWGFAHMDEREDGDYVLLTDYELLQRERDALREAAIRAIGEHHAPSDCYATGPLTGDVFVDLVQCHACAFLELAKGATQ